MLLLYAYIFSVLYVCLNLFAILLLSIFFKLLMCMHVFVVFSCYLLLCSRVPVKCSLDLVLYFICCIDMSTLNKTYLILSYLLSHIHTQRY